MRWIGIIEIDQTREVKRAQLLLLLGAILLAQSGQKVEGGSGPGQIGRIGGQSFDLEVALAVLDGDGCGVQVLIVEIEFETTEVEGIKSKGYRAAGERGVDLVGVALQGDSGIAPDLALFAPQEG
jgi:hypothetical protein